MTEEKKSKETPSDEPGDEPGAETPKWVDDDPFTSGTSAAASPPAASAKVSVDPALQREVTQAQQHTKRAQSRAPRPAAPRSAPPPITRSPTKPTPTRISFLGVPLVGWVLIFVFLIGVLFIAQDLRNRDRYMLVCRHDSAEIHQGRTFPWPFGHVAVGGEAFRPITLAAETDCREGTFQSEEEATQGYLDLILNQVRGVLDNPGTSNLTDARRQVQQALILSRSVRLRRQEAENLLAHLSYQEGRTGLARAENDLRLALSRFQETQKLAAERFEDLDDWITHLEEMLRTISPSPVSRSTPSLSPPVPLGRGVPSPSLPLSAPTPLPSPGDAGIPPSFVTPDAGAPAAGGGILM